MLLDFFKDAVFAAIAAIGFASISNPPRKAFLYCAILAAVGHSLRFLLINTDIAMNIIPASTVAAFAIGMIAVKMASHAKFPAETCIFPSLLPMIPGIYAYRAVAALMMCLLNKEEAVFDHYYYLLTFNGLTCVFIVLGMAIGGSIPIFIFKKISFQATRS